MLREECRENFNDDRRVLNCRGKNVLAKFAGKTLSTDAARIAGEKVAAGLSKVMFCKGITDLITLQKGCLV